MPCRILRVGFQAIAERDKPENNGRAISVTRGSGRVRVVRMNPAGALARNESEATIAAELITRATNNSRPQPPPPRKYIGPNTVRAADPDGGGGGGGAYVAGGDSGGDCEGVSIYGGESHNPQFPTPA